MPKSDSLGLLKVILLDYSSEHAEVGEQVIKDKAIQSSAEKGQHINPPKTAMSKARDIVEEINEVSSNSTHGLDSIGEDSEYSLLEGRQELNELTEDCLENLAQSKEAQEAVGAGL